MCGIVAAYWNPKNEVEATLNAHRLAEVMAASNVRGHDGWGLAYWDANTKVSTFYKFENSPNAVVIQELIEHLGDGSTIIFATRAAPVTEGGVIPANTHPHVSEDWLVVHNGIISNDEELVHDYALAHQLRTDVDTEVVAHVRDWVGGPAQLAERLVGGFALAMINRHDGTLEIIRNYKTLWQTSRSGLYVVASEAEFLVGVGGVVAEFPKESWLYITGPVTTTGRFSAEYWSHVPEMDRNKALVVISGGMDSSLVAHIAQELYAMDVTLFHVNYKHKSEAMESEACAAVAAGLDVELISVDADWLGELGASPLTSEDIDVPLGRKSSKTSLCWTPARNLVFLSMAAAYAEAKGIGYILYGSNLEEEGPAWKDNDLAAVRAFDDAFFYGTLGGVRLFNVLGRLMKRDIIALGTHLGVPLDKTCSCDEPVWRTFPFELSAHLAALTTSKWVACGRCGCCHNRRHAYMQAKIDDPQEYAYDMIDHYPSTDNVGETDTDDIIEHRLLWPEPHQVVGEVIGEANTRALMRVARRVQ